MIDNRQRRGHADCREGGRFEATSSNDLEICECSELVLTSRVDLITSVGCGECEGRQLSEVDGQK